MPARYLVIDVRDVHAVKDVELEVIPEHPPQDVEGDVGPRATERGPWESHPAPARLRPCNVYREELPAGLAVKGPGPSRRWLRPPLRRRLDPCPRTAAGCGCGQGTHTHTHNTTSGRVPGLPTSQPLPSPPPPPRDAAGLGVRNPAAGQGRTFRREARRVTARLRGVFCVDIRTLTLSHRDSRGLTEW